MFEFPTTLEGAGGGGHDLFTHPCIRSSVRMIHGWVSWGVSTNKKGDTG